MGYSTGTEYSIVLYTLCRGAVQSARVNIAFLILPLRVLLPCFWLGPLNDGQTFRTTDRLYLSADYPYDGQTLDTTAEIVSSDDDNYVPTIQPSTLYC